jgi:hypothetical protein
MITMKKVLKSLYFVFLATTISFSFLHAVKPTKKQTSEDPFRHTKKKASLLDKIADYAYIIANTSDKKIGLAAKKELQILMKKLESEIYDELYDDYHIIITNYPHDHVKVVKAYHQLIEKIEAIKAKQQLVKTIDDATITVNAVSDELKPAVIAEQQKKIEMDEANAQQKGFLSKLKTKILGDEISWSKAAFYAAVGAATLAGLYYGYRYYTDYTANQTPDWLIELQQKNQKDKETLQNFLTTIQKKEPSGVVIPQKEVSGEWQTFKFTLPTNKSSKSKLKPGVTYELIGSKDQKTVNLIEVSSNVPPVTDESLIEAIGVAEGKSIAYKQFSQNKGDLRVFLEFVPKTTKNGLDFYDITTIPTTESTQKMMRDPHKRRTMWAY